MKKLIHTEDGRGQLHCDNPACRYVLPEGTVTWGPHLIGYPCPKCESDMLTREDYEHSERFHRAVAWINYWFGWLGSDDPADYKSVSIRHHAGKTIIKQEDD